MKLKSNLAFIFPSRSKIKCNHIESCYNSYSKIREYFDTASNIHGFDFYKYSLSPSMNSAVPFTDELVTLLISVSNHYVFKKEVGIAPSVITGLSMGLYSGLVASGALSFGDSFRLLKYSMESGAKVPGKMTVISGLTYDEVRKICVLIDLKNRLFIANHNSEYQIVVSGESDAVEKAKLIAMELNAISCIDLYDGQYHSPKNKPYADKMADIMGQMNVLPPETPILFLYNLQQATTQEEVRTFLCTQLYSPVRWFDAINLLHNNGIHVFLEFGPDKMLTKLLNSINKKINCIYFNDPNVSQIA